MNSENMLQDSQIKGERIQQSRSKDNIVVVLRDRLAGKMEDLKKRKTIVVSIGERILEKVR